MEYGSLLLEDGKEIFFEVHADGDQTYGPVPASLKSTMEKTKINLLKEASSIGAFVSSFREAFIAANNDESLAETEIEVGIDFDNSLGCALISSSIDCQFKIKVKWKNEL